jgi:Flp pilus assembly protein TadD
MTKLITIFIAAMIAIGCNSAARPVAQNGNTGAQGSTPERPQTAISHSLENQQPPTDSNSAGRSKWKQGGRAIDTKALDTEIASAEKSLATKPADDAAKKALSAAYFKRGVALVDAQQYASALGDFRRTVKYDSTNAEAKNWIDQIITIYDSMGRDSPKEGEEPPPLPFDKPN